MINMNLHDMNATIVGVLFITATVMAVLGGGLLESILKDPDYIINVSEKQTQVIIGVLLELIVGVAVFGIAVMMFPLLKNQNEGLALGYVGFRIIEGVMILVGAIIAASLITLSRENVKAGAPDASYFQTLGTLFQDVRLLTFLIGPTIIVSLSDRILNYLLYISITYYNDN